MKKVIRSDERGEKYADDASEREGVPELKSSRANKPIATSKPANAAGMKPMMYEPETKSASRKVR